MITIPIETYVMYDGQKFKTIMDAVNAIDDELETAEIKVYDIDGSYETQELERNPYSGDFEYVSYYIFNSDYDIIEEEINTEAEAIEIAEQIKAKEGYEKLIVQPILGTIWETEESCGKEIEV